MMKIIRAIMISAAIVISSLVAVTPAFASNSMPLPTSDTGSSVVATQTLLPTSAVPLIQHYTVKPGDYLAKIAPHFKMTWQSLYCENAKIIGRNPDMIRPGERLNVDGRSHVCIIDRIPISVPVRLTNKSVTHHHSSGSTSSTTATRIPQGSLQSYARSLVGSSYQYGCLNSIIMTESGWSVDIHYGGGHGYIPGLAYGIPQALPGDKMASEGADWRTNGYTQLRWMVKYVNSVYGSACAAWSFHLSHGAY